MLRSYPGRRDEQKQEQNSHVKRTCVWQFLCVNSVLRMVSDRVRVGVGVSSIRSEKNNNIGHTVQVYTITEDDSK